MIKFKAIKPDKGALTKQLTEARKAQLSELIKRVRCPEHDQAPEIVVSGTSQRPEFKIKGCCQKAIDEAMRILSREP